MFNIDLQTTLLTYVDVNIYHYYEHLNLVKLLFSNSNRQKQSKFIKTGLLTIQFTQNVEKWEIFSKFSYQHLSVTLLLLPQFGFVCSAVHWFSPQQLFPQVLLLRFNIYCFPQMLQHWLFCQRSHFRLRALGENCRPILSGNVLGIQSARRLHIHIRNESVSCSCPERIYFHT